MLKSINKGRFPGKLLSAVMCAVMIIAFMPVLAGVEHANAASYDKAANHANVADATYQASDGVKDHAKSAIVIAKKDSEKKNEKDSEETAVEPDQPEKSTDVAAKEPSGDTEEKPSKLTSSFGKGFAILAIGGAIIFVLIVALLIRLSKKKAAKECEF